MAELEAEAAALLDALDAGTATVDDVLGRLYGKAASPDAQIPRAGPEVTITTAPEHAMGPSACEDVKSTVAHVGPRDHFPALEKQYDLVVIGAGVAGLLSVITAKALGKRALLIEKHYMGGDCLNVGCVPSKCLVASAKALHNARASAALGVVGGEHLSIDFPRVMARMREIRAGIAPHDGVARYARDFCAEVIIGEAAFADGESVTITARDGSGRTQTVAFDRCMIATGASAAVPPAPGLVQTPHLTNGNFFNLTDLPPSLGLIGAGPIGLEMAQSLARFGCKVVVFEMADRLLPCEDADAAAVVGQSLEADGVVIHTACRILNVAGPETMAYEAPFSKYEVRVLLQDGSEQVVNVAALLNATGRAPNVNNLNLEAAGVAYDARSGVHTDDCYATANPKIYACGDVASAYKFTHVADWQARCAVRNAFLDARCRRSRLLVPWCTYVDPEVACVGASALDLEKAGTEYDTYMRPLKEVDRCKCDGVSQGFVKIRTRKGGDAILGAMVVAPHAGDLISELTVCMQNGVGLADLAGVMHPYPTTAEAVRQCAAQYWFSPAFKTPAAALAIRRRGEAVAARPAGTL